MNARVQAWHTAQRTTYHRLLADNFEVFSPLHDELWNLVADDTEFDAAMLAFTEALTAAGWSWRRWIAAEQEEIRQLSAAAHKRRRKHNARLLHSLRQRFVS